ncbi:hypothetical protein GGR51DRAFT_560962 [Nemania sp. FL0031]|nr:hypothetical protein GGR51DRAFT_560962 [Nemania sp. FL0031]
MRSSVVQSESRSLVHPTTIDTCLQLIITSTHTEKYKTTSWGLVPVHIEEVTIVPWGAGNDVDIPAMGHAIAWTDAVEGRHFDTHVHLTDSSRISIPDIKNLACIAFEAAKPDIARLALTKKSPGWSNRNNTFCSYALEMFLHRQAATEVSIFGAASEGAIINILPQLGLLDSSTDLEFWRQEFRESTFDVVIAHTFDLTSDLDMPVAMVGLQALLRGQGWLIGGAHESAFLNEKKWAPYWKNPRAIVDVSNDRSRAKTVAENITRAGDQVTECEIVGKRVITFVAYELRTVIHSSAFVVVEDSSYSNDELVSMLGPLIRIVKLILTRVNIRPGDSIVALPGPKLTMRLLAQLAIEFQ